MNSDDIKKILAVAESNTMQSITAKLNIDANSIEIITYLLAENDALTHDIEGYVGANAELLAAVDVAQKYAVGKCSLMELNDALPFVGLGDNK